MTVLFFDSYEAKDVKNTGCIDQLTVSTVLSTFYVQSEVYFVPNLTFSRLGCIFNLDRLAWKRRGFRGVNGR